MRLFFILCVCFIQPVAAQTINPATDPEYKMSDPIEPINRVFWDFNYKILDPYIYKPTTETYVDWVPTTGRKSINNFVANFSEPSTVINNLLQLEFEHGGKALFRFVVNTTLGVLGFFDVADEFGVPRRRESFSNVLGRWSVPNGPYLMLPVLGPSSPRKLVGNFVDGLYFPMSYISFWDRVALLALDGLDKREQLLGQETLLEQSLDPYLFVKEAYIQYEAFKFYSGDANAKIEFIMKTDSPERTGQPDPNLDSYMDEID
ncbi:VacJ family lipoprotein [Psychromonas sp. MME2]|uniref:MlaA family lipoprotein n=1 Tax=unclassified Psychromonas TaxID=2614957 RepID=UPI00339C7F87